MKTERNNLFTCTELPEKERRNLTIFELIRKKGLISKPEISKITGINIVSVTNYIESYIAKSLVSERESGISSGGRKPELVELNKTDRFVVGADIASAGASLALADLYAKPVTKAARVNLNSNDTNAISESVLLALEDLLKRSSVEAGRISAVGIAVADRRYIGIGDSISKRLGIDVFIGGRAQCAAFGERWLDNDIEADDILYVHSDLGRCIVIRGSTCFGALGNQAEIELDGNNGISGDNTEFAEELKYLRPWSPTLGAVAAARAQVARGVGTKIVDAAEGRLDNISVETVINAARDKDAMASDILNQVGTNLGVRIAYLINAFRPKKVIIGGGIESAGDLILDPIKSMVGRFAFAKQAYRVKIKSGALGDDAVCIGAASLAVREVFLRA